MTRESSGTDIVRPGPYVRKGEHMAGKPVHFEIPASDTSRAREFYAKLFGWNWDTMEGPVEYHMTRLGEEAGAGIFPGDTGAIRTYFDVDDINAGVARVKELGGKADDPQPGAVNGVVRDRVRHGRESDRSLADGSERAAAWLERPGVAGVEQRLETAFLRLARDPDLVCHQLVVDRALDCSEDADRRRADGALRQP